MSRRPTHVLGRLPWIVVASLLFSACSAHVEGDPEPASTVGHRKMLALLREIAGRTADEHFFLGDKTARQLKHALSNLAEDADPQRRWKLHHQSGVVELRLGNVQESIDHFTNANDLLSEASLDARWHTKTKFDLAMAYMRLGEVENCCLRNAPESCVLPIRKGGVHRRQAGSKNAIRLFTDVLKSKPRDRQLARTARWLLNVAYMTVGGYPGEVPEEYLVPPEMFQPEVDFPRFNNVASLLGLDTFNLSGGAIVDDFDNDHCLDIITSTWDTRGQLRFFRNNADGTFSEHTGKAGLNGLFGGLNLKHADYDNDGFLDVLVLRGAWLADAGRHPNSLLHNNGDGTFTDVTFDAGLGSVHHPTQSAGWADFDNDGDVDLYVGNEYTKRWSAPCQLFRNNSDGTFTDVASTAGVENNRYTKGVTWGDFDNDRFPDLYVSNLSGANRLYRNNGDSTFTDVAPELGVIGPQVSFPVWFWDFDNDGVLDLFVSSYEGRVHEVAAYHFSETVQGGLPCLYRGDGKGGFQDVALERRLNYPALTMGSNFGDLNGDGYLDFYLGTGDPGYASLMPNLMFLNKEGAEFVDVSIAGGFSHLQKGHSVAFADVDNDGDADVFEQMGGAFKGDAYYDALYENPGFANRWITVKLVGVQSNRAAIGARLHVRIEENGGDERSIYRHVSSGGSFGGNPFRQTIGLGKARNVLFVEVFWPRTGRTQRFSGVALDQAIRIVEDESRLTRLELPRLRLKLGARSTDGG